MGLIPPPRFPFGSLWGGPMAVEPTCLVASLATRLCTRMVFVSPSATHGQKLVGLLGLWLRFHGADPPRFPFWLALGWPHGGRACMPGGFIGDAPVHADGATHGLADGAAWACMALLPWGWSPSVSFLLARDTQFIMPSGLGSASPDASACSTRTRGWLGCGSFGDAVAECT